MKKFIVIIVFLLVIIGLLPVFLPSSLEVEVEKEIDGSVETVFNQFNNLKKFSEWNAWMKQDTAIELHFYSPYAGVGASYQWKSELPAIGNGSMTIQDLEQNKYIDYTLVFDEVEGNKSRVTFEKINDQKCKVVWSFKGAESNYPYQVLNVILKPTITQDLENGLSALNRKVQNLKPTQLTGIQKITIPSRKLFAIEQQTSTSAEEINMAMQESFGFLRSYLVDAQKLTPEQLGKPITYWTAYDSEKDSATFFTGYFVNQQLKLREGMKYVETPSGEVLTFMHQGPYTDLPTAYTKLESYAHEQGYQLSNKSWDIFLNHPDSVATQDLKTQVFIPITKESNKN